MNVFLFMLVLFVSFLIQAVTGFGGTLIAMPLGIALVGVEYAKPAVTVLAWVTGICTLIPIIRHTNKKELLKMAGVMLVFVLAGLFIFKSVGMNWLMILYGAIIIVIGVRRFFFPSQKETPSWLKYVCLGAAGLMQGLYVSGGSFLAVYAADALKEKQEFRATMSAVWSVLNVFMISSYVVNGSFVPGAVTCTLWGLIPAGLAVVCGTLIAHKISKETFLKVSYVILMLSGTILIVDTVVKYFL